MKQALPNTEPLYPVDSCLVRDPTMTSREGCLALICSFRWRYFSISSSEDEDADAVHRGHVPIVVHIFFDQGRILRFTVR